MIIRNNFMNCNDLIRDAIVNGELLTFTVSHRLESGTELSGWFVDITTHDPATKEVDWGFCSGWTPSYPEAVAKIKADPAYKRYPFPI